MKAGNVSVLNICSIVVGCLVLLIFVGCGPQDDSDLPNIEATVSAAMAKVNAENNDRSGSDVELIIEQAIQATLTAQRSSSKKIATIGSKQPIVIKPTPRPMISSTSTPVPTPKSTSVADVILDELKPNATPEPTAVIVADPVQIPEQITQIMVDKVRPSIATVRAVHRTGSGVIIETSQADNSALVLTNFHIVEGSQVVSVTVGNSAVYAGDVIGADRDVNLALIYVCCGEFTALQKGLQGEFPEGSKAITIPSGTNGEGQLSYSENILNKTEYDPITGGWVMKFDSLIDIHNSGAPLVSGDGKLIGLNAVRVDFADTDREVKGTEYAISIRTIRNTLSDLKAGLYTAEPVSPLGRYSHDSYYWWAYNGLYSGEYESALADVGNAILLDKDHIDSYLVRGRIYQDQNNTGMAISDFDYAISLDNRHIPSYRLRANFYYHYAENYAQAFKNYDQILKLMPLDVLSRIGKADSLTMMGQAAQALNEYTRAIELDPSSAHAYNQRSIAYETLGQNIPAAEDAQRACSMDLRFC